MAYLTLYRVPQNSKKKVLLEQSLPLLANTSIQEHLSYAYVYAIAANAGLFFERTTADFDSIDGSVHSRGRIVPESLITSTRLDVQVKSHRIAMPEGDTFPFPVSTRTYDDARDPDRHVPFIVVVLAMPKDRNLWLQHSHDGLTTRNCAYWHNLKGYPPTTNDDSITIRVKKCNYLSSDTLKSIMAKVSLNQEIGNEL